MKPSEVKRFAALYERHLKLLKLQGKSKSTIDAYSRAVRRIRNHYDCCPDKLTKDQLENYFVDLVESHSWSTVKIDRLGLMFFWKFVLNRDWQWLNIVKPPKVKIIPDTQKDAGKMGRALRSCGQRDRGPKILIPVPLPRGDQREKYRFKP